MKSILIVTFSFFVLVSCGKSQKSSSPSPEEISAPKKVNVKKSTSNVVVDADGVANIVITSSDAMKFDVRKIKVKSGQKVKLTLQHTGKLDKRIMGHNVVILQKGVKLSDFAREAAPSKDNDYIPVGTTDVIAHTKMIGGGETTTIEFTAPAAGTYDFICSFPSHYAMMKGKFIVE